MIKANTTVTEPLFCITHDFPAPIDTKMMKSLSMTSANSKTILKKKDSSISKKNR